MCFFFIFLFFLRGYIGSGRLSHEWVYLPRFPKKKGFICGFGHNRVEVYRLYRLWDSDPFDVVHCVPNSSIRFLIVHVNFPYNNQVTFFFIMTINSRIPVYCYVFGSNASETFTFVVYCPFEFSIQCTNTLCSQLY